MSVEKVESLKLEWGIRVLFIVPLKSNKRLALFLVGIVLPYFLFAWQLKFQISSISLLIELVLKVIIGRIVIFLLPVSLSSLRLNLDFGFDSFVVRIVIKFRVELILGFIFILVIAIFDLLRDSLILLLLNVDFA